VARGAKAIWGRSGDPARGIPACGDRDPIRQAQIEYFDQGDQWTPRGEVLRCVISDGGPDNEPIIHIDDRDLSWNAFGRLLTTYAGCGHASHLRPPPDDEIEAEQRIEVREPRQDER
jgi:predicted small lipoprotein YifL